MWQLPNLHIGPRRRRTVVVAIGMFIVPGALLVGTTIVGAVGDDPVDDPVVSDISTVDVQRRDLSVDYEATGTVEAATTLNVGSPTGGRVLATAEPGSVVTSGSVIARVDDSAIVALTGDVPMWRDLSVGDTGTDVSQLETALVALGFDPDANVTVDDEFTYATSVMVSDWQAALGIDDSGSVLQSEIMMIPEPLSVSSVVAGVGEEVAIGDSLVVLESRTQVITTEIVVSEALTLSVADPVTIEMPDRLELAATVQSINNGAVAAVWSVVIEFDDTTQMAAFGGTTVTINWNHSIAADVPTLPADTFRHLESGIYVVDVFDDDGSSSTVEVQIGAAVGGFVEVFGLAEGTAVARP